MKPTLSELLARHGHLTRTEVLVAAGHSPRSIGRAVATGTLLRVCRGWVATRQADQHAVIAVLHRGILAGPSALLSRGIWDAVSPRIHVQRSPNSHGLPRSIELAQFRAPKHSRSGITYHWRAEEAAEKSEPPWRQSTLDALLVVGRHFPMEQFVASVESAIHLNALSRAGLGHLRRLAPRLGPALELVEPTAESGLETLARIRLRPWVGRLDTQVRIPGIGRSGGAGRVDLLIDQWLVIELDGDEWHDPKVDRDRDAILVRLGYRPHRFGHRQVLEEWPTVVATITELLRYPPTR